MAKVFGIATLDLRTGVNGEEFERFWTEEYAPVSAFLGWKGHLTKADRGERDGKYAVIWEISSIESRNRYWPAPGQFSREMLDLLEPALSDTVEKLMAYIQGWPFTDYVEIEKRRVTVA